MIVEFTLQGRPDLFDQFILALESREPQPFTLQSGVEDHYHPCMAVVMVSGTRERFTVKLESTFQENNTR